MVAVTAIDTSGRMYRFCSGVSAVATTHIRNGSISSRYVGVGVQRKTAAELSKSRTVSLSLNAFSVNL